MPPPEAQSAFNDFLAEYDAALDYTLRNDAPLDARRLEKLENALDRYLQAIDADQECRFLIKKRFWELEVHVGE